MIKEEAVHLHGCHGTGWTVNFLVHLLLLTVQCTLLSKAGSTSGSWGYLVEVDTRYFGR